jgi:hypothetical protein
MSSDDIWPILSETARWLKYVFTAATTILSVISIRHETTYKSNDPLAPKELTPVGRVYMRGVVALATLTIATTIAGDIANNRVDDMKKKKARAESDQAIKEQLDKQLDFGIRPIIKKLGDQVERKSVDVVRDLEAQGKESGDKLRVIQEGLLAKAQRSAEELSALNKGIEASASMTRELSDKQQRLAEAKEQVAEFRITMTIVSDWSTHSGVAPSGSTAKGVAVPAYADFRRSFFHGGPEVNSEVGVSVDKGALYIKEIACPFPESGKIAPCLKGSGTIRQRSKPTGEDAPTVAFDASLQPLFLTQPASSFDISVVLDNRITQGFPILGKDMEIRGFNVSNCVAEGSAMSQMDSNAQETGLRRYEDTLPMWVGLHILEELRADSDGRPDLVTHNYEYVRIHDPTRHVIRGCLQTAYLVSS